MSHDLQTLQKAQHNKGSFKCPWPVKLSASHQTGKKVKIDPEITLNLQVLAHFPPVFSSVYRS